FSTTARSRSANAASHHSYTPWAGGVGTRGARLVSLDCSAPVVSRFRRPTFRIGIANFWNVISNFSFVFIGGLGIWHVARRSTRWQIDSSDRWMYLSFFAAVALMGVGSAFYHLRPNNDRLVWDRLPIAVTFMALFAIIITGYLNRRAGILLFVPLVLLGAATVYYWYLTEIWGRGDLRPYLLTQLYPAVAMPLILWLSPKSYTSTGTLYSAMAWYAGAKVYEFLDKDVFSFGQVI